ncbi:hypothetical protein COJ67_03130 [Bacillus thuringiensis]|uniref:AbiJ-NTD4 domain-containing protein n=1 Tax=Bacillus thuringiensis TaxID=1428 RepID=UPI000BF46EB9|nr:hypothetical protein [Bacillus thuringiensis]MCU5130648.1 hypothetical protein [Bacillus cereus]PFN92109.1 hypothetical protein COJ67_03130 [Bacillus thuringiensis]PGY05570.1 hypothetical protein COE41_02910 [Bacillus thuringiensis]HDX9511354.1 hypothetical protein [Bacillus cereus]
MHQFFSDRECGAKELKSEEITVPIYNGVVGIFNKYRKNFSKHFAETCPDNNAVFDTDERLLNAAIKAQIPNMELPVNIKYNGEDVDKYALLDFIEFCYMNITDVQNNNYHSFFQHYHLSFPSTTNEKERFREEVNQIFARNGIVFYLDSDSTIKRHLPMQLDSILQNLNIKSKDNDLNQLINLAIENIRKPQETQRQFALEKIWDAFERVKTFYDPNNKKASAQTLVANISSGTKDFDIILDTEFKQLTTIGNKYYIRHFETNKTKINSMKLVDYLFYRMIALIDLCMDKVNNEK